MRAVVTMVWEGASLPRFDKTIVLVTRPQQSAERFVKALIAIAPPFHPVISPAFETQELGLDVPDFDTAIFTSQAGVGFAPPGQGRTAFCVGDLTAQAARQSGYASISADGNASDLINVILSERPPGLLMHIRGEVSHGNVRDELRNAGLSCRESIVYRKRRSDCTNEAKAAFQSDQSIIIPLFSSETVSIIASWPLKFAKTKVVAISPIVAQESAVLLPLEIHVSDHPNMVEMARFTSRLIA